MFCLPISSIISSFFSLFAELTIECSSRQCDDWVLMKVFWKEFRRHSLWFTWQGL